MTQTHSVSIEGSVVTKTFVSVDRDEHLREWAALAAISAQAPDLAPTPLTLTGHAARPSVAMSLVPGRSLAGVLSQAELDGLELALRTLWSLPTDGVLPSLLPFLIERVRGAVDAFTASWVVEDARLAGREWLSGDEVDRLLWAIFWLILLRPGGPSAHLNPPETPAEQAKRVLALLA